jgi:threonine dehydrogenase-like Zn-dependent dehydrogenase
MEAHGAPFGKLAQDAAGFLPKVAARKLVEVAGVDRLAALRSCIDATRRGGTISIGGVYGGAQDPFDMMQLFDKQLQIRMGQANVRRWVPDLMPLIEDDSDPLGTEDLATHKVPLEDAPRAHRIFQRKEEGAIKILLQPNRAA